LLADLIEAFRSAASTVSHLYMNSKRLCLNGAIQMNYVFSKFLRIKQDFSCQPLIDTLSKANFYTRAPIQKDTGVLEKGQDIS